MKALLQIMLKPLLCVFLICISNPTWAIKYEKSITKAIDIAVAPNGTVYAIGKTSKRILKYDPSDNKWKKFSNHIKGKFLTVDQNNNPWVVDQSGNIFRYNNRVRTISYGPWRKLPGKAIEIGRGTNGTIWIVGNSKRLFRFNKTKEEWEQVAIPGHDRKIKAATGNLSRPVFLRTDKKIYKKSPRNAQYLSGKAIDIEEGKNSFMYCIGLSKKLFAWNNVDHQWNLVANAPGNLKRVAVGPDGYAWVIDQNGYIHRPMNVKDWKLKLSQLFVPNAQEDGWSGDGDEPYFMVIGFRSKFNTPNSTSTKINYFSNDEWAEGINGNNITTRNLPSQMGNMVFENVESIRVEELLTGKNPELIGQIIIAMESDATSFVTMQTLSRKIARIIKGEITKLIEQGEINILDRNSAMTQINRAVNNVRRQLNPSWSEIASLVAKSAGDPDDIIGIGTTLFGAIQPDSRFSFPSVPNGISDYLRPISFNTTNTPLVFRAEGATYQLSYATEIIR